jgi:uncharacterized membrane protein YphA (DoxX/SURF4 family)
MSASAPPAAPPRGLRTVVVAGSDAQRWVTTVARVVLGGVLVVAGWIKISSPDDAVRAVQAYQILPGGWTHAVGYGLPLLEIALGLMLILGLGTRWAAVGTGVLMVVFIAGIVSVWVRGLSIDCGCFGGGGPVDPAGRVTRYVTEIVRDLVFLGLATWIALRPLSRFSLDGWLSPAKGG